MVNEEERNTRSLHLYQGAKIRYEVKVGMHQGSVQSHFLCAVVVDVVTVLARNVVLSELLHGWRLLRVKV